VTVVVLTSALVRVHRHLLVPNRSRSSGCGTLVSDTSVQSSPKRSEGVVGGGTRRFGGFASRLRSLLRVPRSTCSVCHLGPKRPNRSRSSGSGTLGSDASVQSSSKKSEGVVAGGTRRLGCLASRLTRMLAAHVVLAAGGTRDQVAPLAHIRAGPGPRGVTRVLR
jgi:hypothetical protein